MEPKRISLRLSASPQRARLDGAAITAAGFRSIICNWSDGGGAGKLAWPRKEKILPPVDWQAMLRGRDWLAKTEEISVSKLVSL